jgi:hypothetical protein
MPFEALNIRGQRHEAVNETCSEDLLRKGPINKRWPHVLNQAETVLPCISIANCN